MLKNIRKIYCTYNGLSEPAKASLWFVFCNILQKGISFITTPIFTRIMSTTEYGVFTVYNSWYSILSVFVTLNLFYGVYNNGMTKYPNRRKELTSSMLGLCTTVTIAWFGIYLIAKNFWNTLLDMNTSLMLVMFIQFLFYPAWEFWAATKRYDYSYKSLVIVTIIMSLANPVLGVIAVRHTIIYRAEARIITYALVNIVVGLFLYVRIFWNGRKFFSAYFWKYALAFNIPLIPHYLSASILNQVDRVMISNMVGTSEAAIYSIAYSVAMMMNIVNSALTNAFTPYTYQSIKNQDFNGLRRTADMLSIIMAGMCVGATLFGPEIVKIVASKEYYDAIWIIPPVAASVFFTFLYPLFSNIEFYFEKTKFIMFASCVSAILNIVLNYFFIKKYGYIAAGYTTLACYIMYALVHYLFSVRILKNNRIKKIYNEKLLLVVSILVCVICILSAITYKTVLVRYGIILVLLMTCLCKRKELFEAFLRLKKKT